MRKSQKIATLGCGSDDVELFVDDGKRAAEDAAVVYGDAVGGPKAEADGVEGSWAAPRRGSYGEERRSVA